jgi:formamidopyrimidine-DNA glycosylase
MTGSLQLCPPDAPLERHVRLILHVDDGRQLRFDDQRKFGKIYLMAADGTEANLPWARLGPEPLNDSFTPTSLQDALRGRTARIKPLLLDQSTVAGLGNIYVDEALHLARVHPERRAPTLTRAEVTRLHGAIRSVLLAAVEGRGTTFSSYRDVEGRSGRFQDALRVFHRAGRACPRCGATVRRLVVGGRGTYICPRCQKV